MAQLHASVSSALPVPPRAAVSQTDLHVPGTQHASGDAAQLPSRTHESASQTRRTCAL